MMPMKFIKALIYLAVSLGSAGFACWTGTIKAGTVVNEPPDAVDWLPTLTRLAGGKSPEQPALDGRDI